MYTIVASETFKSSVQRFSAFLSYKYGDEFARQQVSLVRHNIEQHLATNPDIAPISQRLLEIGITEYRQWLLDKHNLIFYKVEHRSKEVHLLALMDSRQNIQNLLFELMLLT
jgi:toxin ParE1/3/4